jgi:hypothetical protein
MKIGFLAPVNGIKQYGTIYQAIVNFLDKKGHEVIHPLSFSLAMVNTWTEKERHAFFEDYHAKLNKTDLIIAECSYPCISMGYEIANAVQQGKEVIILKTKDQDVFTKNFDPLHMKKNVYIYEYNSYNMLEIIAEALSFNPNQKYKKYNILFTPEMIAKLDQIARKKSLPKSVYIRLLLEKGLASEE